MGNPLAPPPLPASCCGGVIRLDTRQSSPLAPTSCHRRSKRVPTRPRAEPQGTRRLRPQKKKGAPPPPPHTQSDSSQALWSTGPGPVAQYAYLPRRALRAAPPAGRPASQPHACSSGRIASSHHMLTSCWLLCMQARRQHGRMMPCRGAPEVAVLGGMRNAARCCGCEHTAARRPRHGRWWFTDAGPAHKKTTPPWGSSSEAYRSPTCGGRRISNSPT
jgi:hypothetical protein